MKGFYPQAQGFPPGPPRSQGFAGRLPPGSGLSPWPPQESGLSPRSKPFTPRLRAQGLALGSRAFILGFPPVQGPGSGLSPRPPKTQGFVTIQGLLSPGSGLSPCPPPGVMALPSSNGFYPQYQGLAHGSRASTPRLRAFPWAPKESGLSPCPPPGVRA